MPRVPPLGGRLRTLRLLSLPAGAALAGVEGALRRTAGQDPDVVRRLLRARTTERTRRVLGELKGGALKAGQLLSTVDALFPSDPDRTWSQALASTQDSAAALPFREVEPVLVAELGPRWRSAFRRFDEQASAAASLGQVHRATTADGRDVAVKVQYPGIREALVTDLRAVSVATRLAGLVARGMAMPPLVGELRRRLVEELDYEHEAAAQGRFGAYWNGRPEVVVPEVVTATGRVLVSTWLDGTPLGHLPRSADQETLDRAGRLYQHFLVSGPELVGLLHTDPHPGNFRLTADGRLGVLDFGSTLRMPGGLPPAFGRLIRALLAGDPGQVLARLRADGFVRPGAELDTAALMDYLSPFSEPARHDTFTFSRSWLQQEFGRVNDPRNPDFAVALQLTLPAEQLFTHRLWLGMVGVLCQLEATVPVRPVLERWLPGFIDSSVRRPVP